MSRLETIKVLRPSQVMRMQKAGKIPDQPPSPILCEHCRRVGGGGTTESPMGWENGSYVFCDHCGVQTLARPRFPAAGFEIDLTGERVRHTDLFVDGPKTAFLRKFGYTVDFRHPRLNTRFAGRFMVVELSPEDLYSGQFETTEDGRNGPFCIVGDDLYALINEGVEQLLSLDDDDNGIEKSWKRIKAAWKRRGWKDEWEG